MRLYHLPLEGDLGSTGVTVMFSFCLWVVLLLALLVVITGLCWFIVVRGGVFGSDWYGKLKHLYN